MPAKRYQTTEELEADLDRLDNHGELIPIKRVVGMKMVSGIVALSLALIGGVWYYARTLVPPPPHEPVSVVIADFQNDTGDSAFDRTLEPALKLALEGAGFISAYDRHPNAQPRGCRQSLATSMSRLHGEIAVSQGLGVVVSGSLAVKARVRAFGKSGSGCDGRGDSGSRNQCVRQDQVLAAATSSASAVRTALGDETSESAQRFAMETLASQSLDVIQEYAQAMEALSNGKNEEARRHAQKPRIWIRTLARPTALCQRRLQAWTSAWRPRSTSNWQSPASTGSPSANVTAFAACLSS